MKFLTKIHFPYQTDSSHSAALSQDISDQKAGLFYYSGKNNVDTKNINRTNTLKL
jgi:hypothetical protein